MYLPTTESANPGGAPLGAPAVPPAVPSGIAREDWDCLFGAVVARLSATAMAERPGAAFAAQPQDQAGRIQTIVRDCVVALTRLHAMQPFQRTERLAH